MRNAPAAVRPQTTLLVLVTLAGVALSASCCSKNGTYPEGTVPIALQEIVAITTRNVLRIPLMQEPELRGRLATRQSERDGITTLAALDARWANLPPPPGVANLEEEIFAEARADGSWEAEALQAGYEPGQVPDAVYLAGFWSGVAEVAPETRLPVNSLDFDPEVMQDLFTLGFNRGIEIIEPWLQEWYGLA